MRAAGKTESAAATLRVRNPMEDSGDEDDDDDENPDMPHRSVRQMIIDNESPLSEEELSQLTYAFQACDFDGSASINLEEFETMLEVLGCEDVAVEVIHRLVRAAKAGFAAWKKVADQEAVAVLREIWDLFDQDKSGTLDHKECQMVISSLRSRGFSPDAFHKADVATDGIDFDEFCTWFLKQEGLPTDFTPTGEIVDHHREFRRKVKEKKASNSPIYAATFGPMFSGIRHVASGPRAILNASPLMNSALSAAKETAKDAVQAGVALLGIEDGDEVGTEGEEIDTLGFAEFVFMMRAGALHQVLPGDWHERATDMRTLREAFNTADVDGDNKLELDELEMVILSLNPEVDASQKDISRVWAVLNPEKKDSINFADFVRGMIIVKNDAALAAIIKLDAPNKWQLLSLLIDSPINKQAERLILDKLTFLEKAGMRLLKNMQQPMDKEKVKDVLQAACSGQLHYLDPVKQGRISSTHRWCVIQAGIIALMFNSVVAGFENFLVYSYETDGVYEAYWTCTTVPPDLAANVTGSDCTNLPFTHEERPDDWLAWWSLNVLMVRSHLHGCYR